jgi:hypothetical protein
MLGLQGKILEAVYYMTPSFFASEVDTENALIL